MAKDKPDSSKELHQTGQEFVEKVLQELRFRRLLERIREEDTRH